MGPTSPATPSRRQAAADKRQRLVEAAWQLMYADGVPRTTLGAIAARADVALGNVYYYFPTRASLIEAVLDFHKKDLTQVLARWDAEASTALAPLTRFIHAQTANSKKIAEQGCHHARLANDLSQEDGFRDRAGDVLTIYLNWTERRFALLGMKPARDLAEELVARIQGGIALATALGRPEILVAEMERTERWLFDRVTDSLGSDAPSLMSEPGETGTEVC